MNPECASAAEKHSKRRDAQSEEQVPTEPGLPSRRAARQPRITQQRAYDNRDTDVLKRNKREPQNPKETVVHHFTANV